MRMNDPSLSRQRGRRSVPGVGLWLRGHLQPRPQGGGEPQPLTQGGGQEEPTEPPGRLTRAPARPTAPAPEGLRRPLHPSASPAARCAPQRQGLLHAGQQQHLHHARQARVSVDQTRQKQTKEWFCSPPPLFDFLAFY